MRRGGSVIADILSRDDETLKAVNLFAAARDQEQVDKISKIGVKAIQLNLNDKSAVEDIIVQSKSESLSHNCISKAKRNVVDIVVHTASAIHPAMISNLVGALGKRHQVNGSKTYLIHVSSDHTSNTPK
jgi:hypothetical protein